MWEFFVIERYKLGSGAGELSGAVKMFWNLPLIHMRTRSKHCPRWDLNREPSTSQLSLQHSEVPLPRRVCYSKHCFYYNV